MRHLPRHLPARLAGLAFFTPWSNPASAAESTFGAALQALVGLALVLALIAGAAFVMKRMNPGRFGAPNLVKTIATLAVGTRERIVVVEMGETWLVLGVTPSSITTLYTTAKGELPAALVAAADNAAPFAQFLRRARGGNAPG